MKTVLLFLLATVLSSQCFAIQSLSLCAPQHLASIRNSNQKITGYLEDIKSTFDWIEKSKHALSIENARELQNEKLALKDIEQKLRQHSQKYPFNIAAPKDEPPLLDGSDSMTAEQKLQIQKIELDVFCLMAAIRLIPIQGAAFALATRISPWAKERASSVGKK